MSAMDLRRKEVLRVHPSMWTTLEDHCTVRTEKEDADGERIKINIETKRRSDGTTYPVQLGVVHVSVSPQQLDSVIMGAVLYSQQLNDEQLEEKETAGIKQNRSRSWRVTEEGQGSRDASSCMIKSLKQWHPNACGYHALYNVSLLLMSHGDDNDDSNSVISERPESEFWAFVFGCIDKLKARNRDEGGLWASSKLENATLDETHMEYLISIDPFLRNCCSVINDADIFSSTVSGHVQAKERHGYILGCSSHWIAGALAGDSKFYFMDSHNKNLCEIPNSESSSYTMAHDLLEAYRPVFRKQMKGVDRYKHYPDDVLDSLFENGIPEYWKGTVKDTIWWHHRPAKLRTQILFQEIEKAREYINLSRDILWCPTTLDDDDGGNPLQVLPVLIPRDKKLSHDSKGICVNLTHEDRFYTSHVRRDEHLQSGDVGYDPNAPPTIENRKVPPPPEVPGDAFDRQRVIVGFDQALMERQSCLIVGTGGIGMNVALTLARLGVGKIILVDYDTYDASNLTRQCLGTRNDVGKMKTEVARKNIEAHNIRSDVETLNVDIIVEWDKVVHAAKDCSVIFNCCDAGLMVDYALNSLSKEFEVPLVSGQSFGWKYMSEFYTGQADHNCAFCMEGTRTTFSCHQLESVWKRLETFLEVLRQSELPSTREQAFQKDEGGAVRENGNEGVSKSGTVVTFADLARFMQEDSGFRLYEGGLDRIKELFEFQVPQNEVAFGVFLEHYYSLSLKAMLPGEISKQGDLTFIPRPQTPSTRFIGSWVCPCLGCGVTCVSHWSMYLTGPHPQKRNPPTTILFNMDEGMTADEQMAYECGVALEKSERSFARSPSQSECAVCSTARKLKSLQRIFFGEEKVWLRPVGGNGEEYAAIKPAWNYSDPEEVVNLKRKRIRYLSDRIYDEASSIEERLLIPFVPAVNPSVERSNMDLPSASSLWPFLDLGASPLIKSTHADALDWPGYVPGIASGVRSAVIPISRTGKCYRLKGCGNRHEGFPLEVMGDDGKSRSLRGCSFDHTAARELFMVEYLENFCGINCANRAVGFYRYPDKLPRTSNEEMKWEGLDCIKYCAVFETTGEKRLGDNLLQGLERLMLKCIPYSLQLEQELIQLVKDQGRWDLSQQIMWETSLQVECEMDVVDFAKHLKKPLEVWTNLENVECGEYQEIWNDLLGELQTTILTQSGSTILHLASRLGKECGETLRKMHQGGVSWGTFPDEMGIHCNAHANNFVVDTASKHRLLGAVDFDMAFTRDSFVEGCWEGKDQFFPKDFNGILKFEETMGMLTSLAGSDFSSTGVSNSKVQAEGNPLFSSILRNMLRDTLVAAFLKVVRAEESATIVEAMPLAQAKVLTILCLIADARNL